MFERRVLVHLLTDSLTTLEYNAAHCTPTHTHCLHIMELIKNYILILISLSLLACQYFYILIIIYIIYIFWNIEVSGSKCSRSN